MLVRKIYKVEVFPEPYVIGVEANNREEARELVRQLYPDKEYKIVVTHINSKIKRNTKGILNKMKLKELLK